MKLLTTVRRKFPELFIIMWPIELVKARALAAGADTPKAVIILTGALNPVHNGHVASLVHARAALEETGIAVLAGVLSPSHETYVRPKMARTAGGRYWSTHDRLECCRRATAGSDWMCVGAWEAAGPHTFWPDFPVVCQALQAELVASEGLRDVRVYFVCGADHWKKCRLHRGMPGDLGLVVLPRDGVRAKSDPKKRIVAASSAPPDVSSTRIRRCLEGRGPLHEGMLPPAVEEYLRECPLPPPE